MLSCRRLFRAITVLIVCINVELRGQEPKPASPHWKAGVAKVSITPEVPMWMAGYAARTRPAIGKLSDLWAKVLVLEDERGKLAVLVTLDLVGIDRALADSFCRPLMQALGIERSQIAICCSHTHSGPALWKNLQPLHYLLVEEGQQAYIRAYTESLSPKIVAAVKVAHESLQPSRLFWGSGTADFAVNRRENRPEQKVPESRTEGTIAGPFQHDVPVLAVRNMDDGLLAVVFGYACHSTVLDGYRWCGDYPGFAQLELETTHPDCIALFWAGCGADQNPLPRRTVALARHYGKRLATAVDAVLLTSKMESVSSRLETRFGELPLAYGALPSSDQLTADLDSDNRYVAARARMLLDQIADGSELPESYPFPIGTWQLGGSVEFVFLGGETVVDYAIRLKDSLRGKATWVASYANDVMAYIPSERVLAEGGYEGGGATVYYGLPAPWAPGLEEKIVRAVTAQLAPAAAHDAGKRPAMDRIAVAADGKSFLNARSQEQFKVWGVNYDHNEKSQLIEDYWHDDWQQVIEDFREMKELGVNVVRVHLQLSQFMESASQPNTRNLARLELLLRLAETEGLYLNLTGLGCYRKADVPAWYDALGELERWNVQAAFWGSVASTCKDRPVVFCYDLMNEPILDGGEGEGWLTGELGGFHFVQRITRDLRGRKGSAVAGAWSGKLVNAIRAHDPHTLITVGVIPWAHVFPKAKPLFYSPEVAEVFDFVSVPLLSKGRCCRQSPCRAFRLRCGKTCLDLRKCFPFPARQTKCLSSFGNRRIWVSLGGQVSIGGPRSANTKKTMTCRVPSKPSG